MIHARSKLIHSSAILGVTLLVCGAIGPARGENAEGEVSGIVTAVGGNTVPNTVTMQTADAAVTITVTTETELEVDDQKPPVTDLSTLVGLFAKVEYDPSTGVAHEMKVENEFRIFGQVVKVEGTAFPYSVAIQPFYGAPVALTVNADTKVEREDNTAVTDLAALVGHFVKAEYDSRTGIASEIELDKDKRLVAGVVASIDVVNRLLVVHSKAGDVTFSVPQDADVSLDFQEASLANLALGNLVLVQFEVDAGGKNVAEKINAVTPRPAATSGTITGVSTSGHMMTMRSQGLVGIRSTAGVAAVPSRPAPTVMKVNAGTLLLLDGRRATLGTLPPGTRVRVQYVTRNGLAVARKLIANTPPAVPFTGTITAKTPAPATTTAVRWSAISGPSVGTVEVTRRDGSKVPVAIYNETRIKINGKLATFNDLEVGERCQVVCIPRLDGQNADGTDNVSYHAVRLEAKKPRAATGTR